MGFESMPTGQKNDKTYTPSQLKAEKEKLDVLFEGITQESVRDINNALNLINEDPLESILEKMEGEDGDDERQALVSLIKEFNSMGARPKDIAQGVKLAFEAHIDRISEAEDGQRITYNK